MFHSQLLGRIDGLVGVVPRRKMSGPQAGSSRFDGEAELSWETSWRRGMGQSFWMGIDERIEQIDDNS